MDKCGAFLFDESNKGFTVIAHNGKAFDFYFIYDYLLKNGHTPELIMTGSKTLYMYLRKDLNICFLDSISFLPMALSKLPKTFGFEEEKHKSYFPHFFNSADKDWEKEYDWPSPEDYGVDNMDADSRAKFMEWHSKQVGKKFHFGEEMAYYCALDVSILRIACMRFKKILQSVTGTVVEEHNKETNKMESEVVGGMDPFHSVTVASMCLNLFKYLFLEETWSVLLREDKEKAEALLRKGTSRCR